jgi:hypothetical protein
MSNLPGLIKKEITEIGMVKMATFGPEIDPDTKKNVFRYDLGRDWGGGHKETVAFFGLNPSTADHEENDATVTREICFAQDWGFKRLLKGNAFAFRSTDPRVLKGKRFAEDIIGPRNDEVILEIAEQAELIIACWGNHAVLHRRDRQMCTLLSKFDKKVYCFGRNNTGQPVHPLYQPATAPLVRFFVDPGPIHINPMAKPFKEREP